MYLFKCLTVFIFSYPFLVFYEVLNLFDKNLKHNWKNKMSIVFIASVVIKIAIIKPEQIRKKK